METRRLPATGWPWVAGGCATAVLWMDLAAPPGYAVEIGQVVLVAMVLLGARDVRAVWASAAAGAGLILLGGLLFPTPLPPAAEVVNRLLSIAALGLLALLAVRSTGVPGSPERKADGSDGNVEAARRIGALEAELSTRSEAADRAQSELRAFCHSVSHDLRAPLRHIVGYSALLQRRAVDLDSDLRRYLEALTGAARDMDALIRSLGTLSGVLHAPLERSPLPLEPLVRQLFRELTSRAPERAVELTLTPLPEVQADRALLRRVFESLLDNAFKFTRMREPAEIEVGSRREPGGWVLWVRDNGVGFEPEAAGRIFDAFERLHPKTRFEGAGLGLATARRAVERHGGRIWAETEPDRGATLYFSLPERSEPVEE